MLPVKARLNKATDFAAVVRTGQRAGTRHLAIHLLNSESGEPPRVGFIVSAKVGNSVVRHRITRRLRHQIVPFLSELHPGTRLVVRALPASGMVSSAEIAADLTAGIAQAKRKADRVAGFSGARSPQSGR